MLPSFCRVTGNSRNLPKPNYFPLLPPISPVEARRLCRLMGKAVPSEDHQYVPLIEFARQSKAVKCHITSHADDQHHYQQAGNNNASSAAAAGKCRITAKHQINDNYKYLYPVLKENSHDLKQLKKILERMNSRLDSLTVQPGQRFVYQLDDNHLNLVLPAEMEAAIRRGEIENLLISKDGSTVLIRLKDGPSLTLTLKAMAKQPTMDDGLLEGGGQDDEILQKQRQIRQYKKRKISDPKQYSIVQLAPPSPVPSEEEELDPVVVADWNERMSKLTAGHRSAANLLALGTDWRDLLYPKIDTWDWEVLPVIKEEDTPSLPVRNVVPVQLPVDQLLPGLVQSNQVPVLNEDTVGFEAVPVYDEPIRPFKGQLPASYIQALDRITAGSQESTTKLKDLFSDVESLMFLPFVHEVGTVMTELDRGSVGWMVRTERDGVRFVKTRPAADEDGQCVKAIGGMMVPVGQDEERFVVGQQVPSLGFVPGKWVGDSFQPGCVVQNPEGAGFIPGCIFNGVFAAGQITQRDGGPPQFVSGQAVQTLFGPKFLPGRTIQTDEGLKFVAGQTCNDKFHPGQIFQTANGPAFISGVTFDTPQGARFIAGQVDVEGQFVPGQVLMDGPNGQAEFTAGENLETADGPLFLPGQSYKTPDGRTKFCPGRQMVLEDGQKRFVPGETMISKEGRQFVAGVLAEERFIPCQIDLKETSSSSNAGGVRLRPATKEEDIFFCAGLSDGLPIDNSTFSAMPRKKPDMGYMIQHEDKVKFLPTEQNQEELLVGNSNDTIKVVPGQLLEMDDTPKFIPGKTIESALGNIFIPGQAVRTGPNKIEQFVPGQVIDTGNSSSIEGISGPMFCPGQMVNCESGKKFVPGQVFGSKTGPRFVPGKILMSPSGVSTFIPGQVVYSSDRGSVFVPGNIVDTSSGPFFVPGRVVDLPIGGIKFVAGEIIETDSGPRYVTEHETDLDLLDETEDQKEIVVQGFPVTPEELRLITAYPFAALHYPLKDGDGPIINSRMLRQMAAAGVAVNKLTNTIPPPANNNNNNNKDKDGNAKEGNNQSTASLNDVKVVAPKDIDESILGANVFRTTEPPPKPPPANNNNKKKSTAADDNAKANKEGAKPSKAPDPVKVAPPAPAPVVQPVVAAAPEPSDGHVGPSVGSETSQIPLPPVPVAKEGGDGEEPAPAPAPAETGGVSETAKTAEPANSSNAGNEQPPKTSSPPPPSLGNDAKPTTSAVSAAVVPPPSTKTSENQQSQKVDVEAKTTPTPPTPPPPKPAEMPPQPPPPPTDEGAKKPIKPVDPPVVVRPVDPPVQPPTPPTPPAKTTNDNSNNNKNAGLLLAKDKADDDDASKNKRGADTNGPSIVESNCNSGDAGDDANASRLNQQETTKDDSNSAGSVSSSSQSIPPVTDDGNAGTGDKTPSPPPTPRTCDSASNLQPQHEPTTTTGKNGDGDGRGDRDESSVERQVLDIFERIKRDLDSVERDPFIKQTLTDAEALALANGRPDLADKVRQLLDILKNTERDPEVVELIKQILRMKKKLEAEAEEASRAAGSGISAAQSSSQSQQIQSQNANKSSTSSAGNQALNGGQSSNQSKNSNSAAASAVAGAGTDQNSASSQSKDSKSSADKNGKGSTSDSKGSLDSSAGANGSSADQKSSKGSSSSGSSGLSGSTGSSGSSDSSGSSGSSTDQKSNSQENANKSNSANGPNSSDSKSTTNVSSKSDDQSNSTLSSSSSSSNLNKKEEKELKNGDVSRQGKSTTSALADDGRLTSAVKGSQEKDILANSLLNDDQQRTGGSSTATGKAQQQQSSSSTAVGGGGGDGSSCNGQGQTSSLSSSSSISGSQTGGAAGDACLTSQHLGTDGVDAATAANEAARKTKRRQRPSTTSNSDENNQLASSSSRDGDLASNSNNNNNGSAASRPTELAGLDMNKVLRSQKSVDSPSTENRSPIDESKMIDKWQYYNSPISSEPPSRFPKDPNNNNNESKPPPPPPPPEPTRVRKISSERRNPRRVTSRSSSRLCGIDLSEEMSDDNGDLVEPIPADPVIGPNGVTLIPSVITSAKDISRDVIDTLRYSRDEAKKEFYTQKILEAVGLASPSGKRSPSNESEESNGGATTKETGSRSRKSSSAASACIILKDFLQTIVPQEAAHNVLIGDIDYMVIDDEGVRYFESAMGFASRRNSRFDIRQAAATSARSRSGSQDHGSSAGADDLPSATSGPWPWADVGPRSRRASIDEFRKRLLEQDASVTSKTRSPSRERPPSGMIHGRHSVAAFPLSRATSSGYISPSMKPTDSRASRRGSLVEDYAMMSATAMAAANAAILGRKRKVSAADANRQKRFSRTSFDGF